MEEFKGIKGNWTMRMTGKLNESNAYMIAIDALENGCGFEQFATIWAWDEKDEQAQATAQLIATAPELLDMLQEAKIQIEYLQLKFGETGTSNNVLSRIDNVIAKALNKDVNQK